MKSGLSKLDSLYYGLLKWANECVEGKKNYGGTWTLGNRYHDEKETRNVDKFLLKKVISEQNHLPLYLKHNIITEAQAADKAEALQLMKEYLERRLVMYKELYSK